MAGLIFLLLHNTASFKLQIAASRSGKSAIRVCGNFVTFVVNFS
jgi:hypothetical protein